MDFRGALILLFLAAYGIWQYLKHATTGFHFGDLHVYVSAIQYWLKGGNPYLLSALNDFGNGYMFVYPPVFLDFFLSYSANSSINNLFLVFYVSSSILLCVEVFMVFWKIFYLEKSCIKRPHPAIHFIVIVLSCFAFSRSLGLFSIATGNITLYFHFLVLAALIHFHRKSSLFGAIYLVATIVLSSIVKPYYIVYTLVPIVVSLSVSSIIILIGSVFISLGVWLYYYVFENPRILDFLGSLNYQVFVKSDLGYSFYALGLKFTHSYIISLVLHFTTIFSLFFIFYKYGLFRWKAVEKKDIMNNVFILYALLTLINPRMKEYDFFLVVICFYCLSFHMKNYHSIIGSIILSFIGGLDALRQYLGILIGILLIKKNVSLSSERC